MIGRNKSVSVDFYVATGFKLAAGALEMKDGAASARTVEAWRNRSGATYESAVAVWNREDGSIRLEERGAEVDESRLVMSSHKYRRHCTGATLMRNSNVVRLKGLPNCKFRKEDNGATWPCASALAFSYELFCTGQHAKKKIVDCMSRS